MKKIFAILMTICLLAGALSITAFAADEPVMTVSGMTKDGPVKIADYTSFEAGWNFAMEKAKDSKYLDNNQYDRIVVDFFADWKAWHRIPVCAGWPEIRFLSGCCNERMQNSQYW